MMNKMMNKELAKIDFYLNHKDEIETLGFSGLEKLAELAAEMAMKAEEGIHQTVINTDGEETTNADVEFIPAFYFEVTDAPAATFEKATNRHPENRGDRIKIRERRKNRINKLRPMADYRRKGDYDEWDSLDDGGFKFYERGAKNYKRSHNYKWETESDSVEDNIPEEVPEFALDDIKWKIDINNEFEDLDWKVETSGLGKNIIKMRCFIKHQTKAAEYMAASEMLRKQFGGLTNEANRLVTKAEFELWYSNSFLESIKRHNPRM